MNIEDIDKMDFEELWTYFKRNKNSFQEGKVEPVYKIVRFGLNHKFDIASYFNELYIAKPKKELVMINNNVLTNTEINSELEERERVLYEFLCLNMKEERGYRSK